MKVLFVGQNLLFSGQVGNLARERNIALSYAPTGTALGIRAAEGPYDLCILDLTVPRVTPESVTAAFGDGPRPRMVAFGPHVQRDALEAARAAGFEEVVPNSQFAARLPVWLTGPA